MLWYDGKTLRTIKLLARVRGTVWPLIVRPMAFFLLLNALFTAFVVLSPSSWLLTTVNVDALSGKFCEVLGLFLFFTQSWYVSLCAQRFWDLYTNAAAIATEIVLTSRLVAAYIRPAPSTSISSSRSNIVREQSDMDNRRLSTAWTQQAKSVALFRQAADESGAGEIGRSARGSLDSLPTYLFIQHEIVRYLNLAFAITFHELAGSASKLTFLRLVEKGLCSPAEGHALFKDTDLARETFPVRWASERFLQAQQHHLVAGVAVQRTFESHLGELAGRLGTFGDFLRCPPPFAYYHLLVTLSWLYTCVAVPSFAIISPYLSFLVTFVLVFGLFGLNAVSTVLSSPFGGDVYSLDVASILSSTSANSMALIRPKLSLQAVLLGEDRKRSLNSLANDVARASLQAAPRGTEGQHWKIFEDTDKQDTEHSGRVEKAQLRDTMPSAAPNVSLAHDVQELEKEHIASLSEEPVSATPSHPATPAPSPVRAEETQPRPHEHAVSIESSGEMGPAAP
ncbi:MAG: hypothetical protein MHM6MM_003403 [Cercozoa sp. M6MM]